MTDLLQPHDRWHLTAPDDPGVVPHIAIDRQAIVDSVRGGRTRVPRSLQFEFYGQMYLADWDVPAYDPARALQAG